MRRGRTWRNSWGGFSTVQAGNRLMSIQRRSMIMGGFGLVRSAQIWVAGHLIASVTLDTDGPMSASLLGRKVFR